MAESVAEICQELEGIAVIFETVENWHKAAELAGVDFNPYINEGVIDYRTELQGTRFKLSMGAPPRIIRERAALLEKQARAVSRLGKGKPDGWRAKPTLRRARYSKAVYQQFIDDGETSNAEAYKQLFEQE